MLRALFVAGFFLLAFAAGPLRGQEKDLELQPLNSTPIGEDTEVLDQFKRVEARYIPRGEWSRIVRYYQQQLDRTDHGLFSDDGEIYLPLSVYLHTRVAALPAAGVEAYRRRVDPLARKLYDEARATTRLAPLHRLLRRYFNSSFGDQALALAGTLYMELGRFRQALRMLRMIHPSLGPGHLHYPDSKLELDPLRARIAYCLAVLGEGYELKSWFENWDYKGYWGELRGKTHQEELTQLAVQSAGAVAVAGVASWPYLYGGAERKNLGARVTRIGGPKQWVFPDTEIEARALFGGFTAPALSPTVCVIEGQRLYTVQANRIQAADIYNGKLVWEAPIDNQVAGGTARGWAAQRAPTADGILNWRLVADATACSLSLVGRRLFSIQRTAPIFSQRSSSPWNNVNVLRAYEVDREYKDIAQVPSFGGAQEKREPFKNAYWLSTPVAYEGRLYLPAQQEGSYKMFCLDGQSLVLQWVTPLGQATDKTPNWNQVFVRAAAGSPPAAGQGNLYWTSHNGAVYCLDAATGEKVWVARYRRQEEGAAAKLPPGTPAADGPWFLSPPVLAAGRLVVAPRDAHQLLCFDATTGEVQWKSPQGGARVIAGVSQGHVYTAGKYLQAVHLLTGMIAGRSSTGKSGEEQKDLEHHPLTGRPVLTSHEAYLPTSVGLQVFDLASLTQRELVPLDALFRSPGEPGQQTQPRLGNLILIQPGILFSCHSDAIAAFFSAGLKERQISEVTALLREEPQSLKLLQLRAERYAQFNEREKALADYVALYDAAAKSQDGGIYKIEAEEGIIEQARAQNRATGDPRYILLALKYASKMMQPPLKLLLAQSHEQKKQYREALAIYRELRARYSGQYVEIDERRRAQLDVLLDEAIRRVARHLPAALPADAKLRDAALTWSDPARIPEQLKGFARSSDRALLEWVHARWLATEGKQPDQALARARKILERHPGTPAALGCLSLLVEHYERHGFPGRALRLLARIRDEYGKVAWPPATLAALQAGWRPPAKQPDGKQDPPKKEQPKKEQPQKDAPKNGLDYFRARRGSAAFKNLPLPGPAARWRSARYPFTADDKRKLTGQAEDGQLSYQNAHVIGAFAEDGMVFVWADSRIEARSIKDWEVLWRTNKIEAPAAGGTTTYYSSSTTGNMLRELPATRVHRSLDRAVVVHRGVIQGIHLTYGMLKWEVKLPQDKPFGYTAPRRSSVQNLIPPPMARVAVTADRVYALSPGGLLAAYDSQGGALQWKMQIDRLREGRLFVSRDRLILLAAVGAENEKDYRIYRWDELSGKLLSSERIDQPLVALPDRLGPGGLLYLVTEQRILAVDAAGGGGKLWEVDYRQRLLDVVVLPDGRVLAGGGGRFELLDGRSGASLLRAALGHTRILAAAAAGEQLYLLCTSSLRRQGNQVNTWLGAFDTQKRQRTWQQSVQSGYYPYYFELLALEGGAAVVSSYSMQSSFDQMQLYHGGKSRQTFNVRRTSSRSYRTDLEVRHAFAFDGHLFIPEQNGVTTYRSKK